LILARATAKTGTAEVKGVVGGNLEQLKTQLATVNSEISEVDKISNKTADQLKRLKELRARKAEIIREIKEQGGSTSAVNNGSRISGEKKDELRDIDATSDELLAVQKLLFTEGKTAEEDYLKAILSINQKLLTQSFR
jgi:hypothetical protein